MKNGTRQKKGPTVKQQVKELTTAVANIQQAMNIQKIMFQQFGNNFAKIDRDVHNAMGIINDLQYRTLALLELSGQVDKVNEIAERLKLKDFNDASAKEDLEKGYVEDDVVKENSIITLTSVCQDDEDRSIFRTKFNLGEEVILPELKEKLIGLKVGEKVEAKLPDNLTHELEVVAIRKQNPKVEEAQEAESTTVQ